MPSLIIRNLDEGLKAKLRLRAAQHGRSMEAEVREILAQTLSPVQEEKDLVQSIRMRFESLYEESLPIPPRQSVRNPPDFAD